MNLQGSRVTRDHVETWVLEDTHNPNTHTHAHKSPGSPDHSGDVLGQVDQKIERTRGNTLEDCMTETPVPMGL